VAAFDELITPNEMPTVPNRPVRKPQVPLPALLASLLFRFMSATGTLAEHFALLFEQGAQ
jgi:hypothetical protein